MPSELQVDGLPVSPEVPQGREQSEPKAEALPKYQYCLFRSGRERYCLPVAEVEEVVDWPTLTRIPLVPPFLKGIFNLRGVIVPVLDIAYEEERRADSTPTHLVVAAWGRGTDRGVLRVGLTADEMFGTYLTSEPLLVEEAPKDAVHCRGMLRHETKLALALDLSRLAEAFPIPII
jgi:purine-binding chemotaxis protein CheW